MVGELKRPPSLSGMIVHGFVCRGRCAKGCCRWMCACVCPYARRGGPTNKRGGCNLQRLYGDIIRDLVDNPELSNHPAQHTTIPTTSCTEMTRYANYTTRTSLFSILKWVITSFLFMSYYPVLAIVQPQQVAIVANRGQGRTKIHCDCNHR